MKKGPAGPSYTPGRVYTIRFIAVMYPRPAVPSYTELSNILQRYIHEALLGKASPKEALDNAEGRAKRLR